MNRRASAFLLLGTVVWAGCAHFKGGKPPEPTAQTNGGVLVETTVQEGRYQKFEVRAIRFVRVGPTGDLEDQEMPSNFNADGLVYLLDVPPGRYTAVSASYYRRGRKQSFRWDPALSKSSAVEVKPGELVFMGHHEFKNKKAGFRTQSVSLGVDTGPERAIKAFERAQVHLAATLWKDAVAGNLGGLGTSRAPVLDSKKREIPVESTHRFAYVDMLKWGEPQKINGGLEWRQPQDKARLAITFFPQGAKGYKSKEDALEYLRSAGSPEDTHLVTESMISAHKAYTARYTTYYYPPGTLVGSTVKVYVTESIMIAESDGVYFLHYRAQRSDFKKFHNYFKRFIRHVRLIGAP